MATHDTDIPDHAGLPQISEEGARPPFLQEGSVPDSPGNAPIKLPGICFLHVFPLGAEDGELVSQFQFHCSNPPSDGFIPKPHTFYTASIPGMDELSSPNCSTSSGHSSTGNPALTKPMEYDPTTDHKLPASQELVSVPTRQSHKKALFAEHKHSTIYHTTNHSSYFSNSSLLPFPPKETYTIQPDIPASKPLMDVQDNPLPHRHPMPSPGFYQLHQGHFFNVYQPRPQYIAPVLPQQELLQQPTSTPTHHGPQPLNVKEEEEDIRPSRKKRNKLGPSPLRPLKNAREEEEMKTKTLRKDQLKEWTICMK